MMHGSGAPSPWLQRWAHLLPAGGTALDLACGSGRHTRLLAAAGHPVLAVDRDAAALSGLMEVPGVSVLVADLESGDWPLAGMHLAGVVVTNYLWRPRLMDLCCLLEPSGVLIYETFMAGNEAFGKPSNPDFLLRPGELRELAGAAGLRELAFVEGYVDSPKPAMCQAICALRE